MQKTIAIGMAAMMALTAFTFVGTQVRADMIVVPFDKATIQEAIDIAVEGDIVYVCTGTYTEDLTISKGLTLIAQSEATIVGGIWIKDIHTFTDQITVQNFIIDNGTSIDATHDYGIKISGDIGLADKNIVNMHIVGNTLVNCGKTDDVKDEMQWNAAIFYDVNHFGSMGSRYDTIFTGTGEIRNNTIINNLADPDKRTQLGIGVRSGRNMKISYNEINGNVAEGIYHQGPVKTGSIGNYGIDHNTIDLSGWIGDPIGDYPRGIRSYAPQSSLCYNTVISEFYGIVLTYRDETYWGGDSDGDNYNLTVSHNIIHPPSESMYVGLRISGNNSQVTDNEIYGASRTGLLFLGNGQPDWGEGTYCSNNTFEYNHIHDNNDGISTWPAPWDYTYDNVFHYNKIEDNTNYGFDNAHTGEVVDARYNWWGHATGPLEVDEVGSEENPHGASALGDSVSDDIDFIPWYATPTTTPSTEYVSVNHNPIIAYSDTIQGGVDAALSGDTIDVAAGTYTEQIIINKDLILQGASGAKIASPDTRNKYMILETSAVVWDPIIFAFGGTLSGGTVIGSDTVSVFIDNFEIDGGNKAASGRYVGIFYRNVDKGMISNISIHHMFDADGKGDGPQTFGILVFGDSDVKIENNDISDFSRGGIGIIGVVGSTDPIATIQGNTVTGNGLEIWPGWWAEYGIQISKGAGGNIIDNDISDCLVKNPSWSSSGKGIDVNDAAKGVNILNCHVTNCDIGIEVIKHFYNLIDGNIVTYCRYDGIRLRWPTDHITVTNNICHHNLWGMTAFDASENLIQSNDLYENDHGIWIDGDSDNNDILGNRIHDNNVDGILLTKNGNKKPKGTEIHNNRIHGNGVHGIENFDLLLAVDATYNWWGHPTGPKHLSWWDYNGASYGPNYGKGDKVSNYVLYDNWKLGQQVVTIDVTPTSLNLQSKGNYMSLKITALGGGYTIDQIDGETLRMLSVIPAESYGVTGQSFSAKFDRADFEDITAPGEVEVLVIGKFLDGSWFYGLDTITAHM